MSLLLGRYELVSRIASGGSAEVHLAVQWGDGGFRRHTIVKVLHKHLGDDYEAVSSFCREGRILSMLSHAALPPVHEFRCLENRWFLSQAYVPGVSLRAILREGPLELAAVLEIGCALCDALEHVHTRELDGEPAGIVHGDLSLQNILISPQGQLSLIDFGLATLAADRAAGVHQKGVHGTIGYVAPESVHHRAPVTAKADVFVVGAILYELATGQRMVPGDGIQYLNAVTDEAPVDLSELERLPLTFRVAVERAVQRAPEDRWESAGALGKELRALAGTLGLLEDFGALGSLLERVSTRELPQLPVLSGRPPRLRSTSLWPAPPVPSVPPAEEESLSAVERDALLEDLSLFSPESDPGVPRSDVSLRSVFGESEPPAPESNPPRSSIPVPEIQVEGLSKPAVEASAREEDERAQSSSDEFELVDVVESLDELEMPADELPTTEHTVPSNEPSAAEVDDELDLLFASPTDEEGNLVDSVPPEVAEGAPAQRESSSARRPTSQFPHTLQGIAAPVAEEPVVEAEDGPKDPLESASSAPGFYIYVADED